MKLTIAGLLMVAVARAELPLSFESNQGQFDPAIRFATRANGHGIFLSPNSVSMAGMRMVLSGAAVEAPMTGLECLPGHANYFRGSGVWRNVPTFAKVWVAETYPGIDLIYYGNQHRLEYDFIVRPGFDPGQIRLSFEGADDVSLDTSGNLIVRTERGDWSWRKPRVARGECRYAIENCEVGFYVEGYDPRQPLIIDPELIFATYLGGSYSDDARGMTIDADGNIILAGITGSHDFPVTNAFQSASTDGQYPKADAFVTKVNADGTAILYSTYFGGSDGDEAFDVAVDDLGEIVIAGRTTSTDLPIMNAIQPATLDYQPYGDGFVAKFTADGSGLVFSTYLGGDYIDALFGVAVDSARNVYVTGYSWSTNYPTVNAIQPNIFRDDTLYDGWGSDVVVTKLAADGSAILYSTYLGGDSYDLGRKIAVDSSGNAYVVGSTGSTNFPVNRPLQPFNRGGAGEFANNRYLLGIPETYYDGDGFVTKISPEGTGVVYSTYLGSERSDTANAIRTDAAGNAYVAGTSYGSNFPAVVHLRPFDPWYHGAGAFVVKIASNGTILNSVNLGDGYATGIALAEDGSVAVVGNAGDPQWPPTVPAPENCGGGPLAQRSSGTFFARLGTALTNIIVSGRIAGTSESSVSFGEDGAILLAGSAGDALPVTNALQENWSWPGEAFLARIIRNTAPTFRRSISSTPNPVRLNYPAYFSTAACDPENDPLNVWWIFDGTILNGSDASYSFASLGTNFVQVFASDGLLTNSMTTNVDVRVNTAAGTIAFSECWSRGPVKVNIGAEHYTQVLDLGRYSLQATLSLEAVDITQLSTDTTFRIALGDFDFSGKLGDDPFYSPGKTNIAVVYRAGPVITGEKSYTWLAFILRWNSQQLTIDLDGIPSAIDSSVYYGPIVGNLFYGQSSGNTNGATGAILEFDRALAIIDVPFAAKVKTRMPKKNGTIRTQVKAKGAGSASQ